MISSDLRLSTRVGRREFLGAEIGSKLVLMNVAKGTYVGLDSIGAAIWQRLEAPVTVGALCEALRGLYQVERAVLERDVLAFLDKMRAQGLVDVLPTE